jgi:hypothetical protein
MTYGVSSSNSQVLTGLFKTSIQTGQIVFPSGNVFKGAFENGQIKIGKLVYYNK